MNNAGVSKKLALVALVVVALGALPWLVSPFYVRVLLLFYMSAVLAVAWNILGGFAGYWSFGHAAFFGMGAFGAAHLGSALTTYGSNLATMAVVVAGATLICAVFAAVIAYPLLRLRGIYFAIAMLGVSQVVGELVNNIDWFGGGVGVFLPSPVPAGVPPERFYYFLFGGVLACAMVLSYVIRNVRFGYGLLAIREDEDTAKMLGVPTEQYKVIAFIISAAVVGITGAIYGYSLGYISTTSVFRIDIALNMIVFCIIGGIGTIFGPVLGTAIMMFITQILLSRYLDIHLMITGILVVVMILLIPGGLLGTLGKGRRFLGLPGILSVWRRKNHGGQSGEAA